MTSKTNAIQSALMGDWQSAIQLNQELLKETPDDIETLNRLAFAFAVLGKVKNAKDVYQAVLKLDGKNPIALKNLKRLSESSLKTNKKGQIAKTAQGLVQINNMFLEESGKTKVVELVNVAQAQIIATLMTGELLALSIKRLKIFLLDEKKRYVGMLPDDLGKRLIKFMKGGNTYQAFVKSIENRRISVFLKETNRATRFKNQPSFTLEDKKSRQNKNQDYAQLRESEEPSDDSSVF